MENGAGGIADQLDELTTRLDELETQVEELEQAAEQHGTRPPP